MFELPAVPAGVLLILGVFSPFAIAVVNHRGWSPTMKKIVAVIVPAILGGAALWIYYAASGDSVPEWPYLILLIILVSQAAFALFFKNAVQKVEEGVGTGALHARHSDPNS